MSEETWPPPPVRFEQSIAETLCAHEPTARLVERVHSDLDWFRALSALPFEVPGTAGEFPKIRTPAALQFFRRLLTLRTATLLESSVRSINDSRLLDFAFGARGLLETAAAAAFHASRLQVSEQAVDLPANFSANSRQAIMGSRFEWGILRDAGGRRMELIEQDDETARLSDRAVNVLTMVEVLAKRLEPKFPNARVIVLRDYALLSDLAHPSYGSHLMFVAEFEPGVRVDLVPPRKLVCSLAGMMLPCLAYSSTATNEVLMELGETQERVDRLTAAVGRKESTKPPVT